MGCTFSCTTKSGDASSEEETKETVFEKDTSGADITFREGPSEINERNVGNGNSVNREVKETGEKTMETQDTSPSNVSDENFTINKIDSAVYSRMKGKSYPENCPIKLDDLRYLTILHYTPSGSVRKGELVCNKSIATDLLDIFHNLYRARYPIESVRLVDEYDADDDKSILANNTSCFNYRNVSGTNRLSKHAYGKAIDINPYYNPYIKSKTTNLSKVIGGEYADRTRNFPMKIDHNDLIYKEFKRHGFKWGGDWNHDKDYQHFVKE